jgi:N-acetylmuramoyl-L-alanine amidase
VFFAESITVSDLRSTYRQSVSPVPPLPGTDKRVRILIVPGHEPEFGGTAFGGINERDFVVDIANALSRILQNSSRYTVIVSRSKAEWNTTLATYFSKYWEDIKMFRSVQEAEMRKLLASGSILPTADQVEHNSAPNDVALRLYGMNRWANENDIDITLHLHINDHAGRRWNKKGVYDGFVLYVPDRQYSNARASRVLGEAIALRLNAYHATSTLPKESGGDQTLIALGSGNTADAASVLIEYGYIFEPQFQSASIRSLVVEDYAYQTYLGLQDFFQDPVFPTVGSIAFPRDWNTAEVAKGMTTSDIYALQAELHHLGFYPPPGKTFSECPLSGSYGICTAAGMKAYQVSRGISPLGVFGPETRAQLAKEL